MGKYYLLSFIIGVSFGYYSGETDGTFNTRQKYYQKQKDYHIQLANYAKFILHKCLEEEYKQYCNDLH
jgi:hypothetical protein